MSKSRVKELRLLNKNKEVFILDGHFLEWFCGFTDSSGNFTITLRNKDDNNRISPYTSAMLTFQISLHLDDKKALERIKNKLQCGKISVSETDCHNKCNFFVNDIFSLVNIIQPIFDNVQLNSSKNLKFQALSG